MFDNRQTNLISNASMEDDSPFLSMADFFSLISLTLIYITIVFSPQPAVPEDAISILSGRVSTAGQSVAVNPGFAYVTLLPDGDGLRLRILRPGQLSAEALTLPLSLSDLKPASNWIEGELLMGPTPDRVVFHMRANEIRANVHMIFNELVRQTDKRYPVSIVFIN